MATIKAIETRYKGYRFRSRLEARWAVFFDAIGWRWEYEPQGYALPSGPYLPDFRLPDLGLWVEVKGGGTDTPDDWALCRELAIGTSSPVAMLFGEFCPVRFDDGGNIVGSNRLWTAAGVFEDGCCCFAECPTCGRFAFDLHAGVRPCDRCRCVGRRFVPRRDRCYAPGAGGVTYRHTLDRCEHCRKHFPVGMDTDRFDPSETRGDHGSWMDDGSPRLLAAYGAAKSARFEHGECG
jgi:hypothetical protein